MSKDCTIPLIPKADIRLRHNIGRFGPGTDSCTAATCGFTQSLRRRYLARGRLRQDGAAELGVNAARLKTQDWPYALIDVYLGRHSLEEARAGARKAPEKCEADFYVGEWHLLRGDTVDAKSAMQAAADTCPKDFVEHAAAVAELKRLNP
jgi:lipoprotein NlpI